MKALTLAVLLLSRVAMAGDDGSQLTLDLTDGSRVIGTTILTRFPLQSEALGKLEIPLAQIRTLKFSRDRKALTVALVNGDRMQASIGDFSLSLRTLVGDIRIAIEHVTTISVAVAAAERTRFSAAGDFSLESNPNGPWSYGCCPADGDAFQIYDNKVTEGALLIWRGNGDNPAVICNTGKTVLHPANSVTILPGQLGFHPGQQGERSVIRWTSPRSGRFQIKGQFVGLSGFRGSQPTTTDVHVFHNSESVFDAFLNLQAGGNEAPLEITRDIKAGDLVDFVVGFGNGNHTCDTTGLEVVISLATSSQP